MKSEQRTLCISYVFRHRVNRQGIQKGGQRGVKPRKRRMETRRSPEKNRSLKSTSTAGDRTDNLKSNNGGGYGKGKGNASRSPGQKKQDYLWPSNRVRKGFGGTKGEDGGPARVTQGHTTSQRRRPKEGPRLLVKNAGGDQEGGWQRGQEQQASGRESTREKSSFPSTAFKGTSLPTESSCSPSKELDRLNPKRDKEDGPKKHGGGSS